MTKPKIAINGFGRIGRLVARAIIEKGTAEVVAINDLVPVETNAHLFKYDSVHGQFAGEVKVEGGDLVINGKRVKCTAEKDPAALPHKAVGADFVVESTGRFTKRVDAAKHLEAGAKYVIISAPANDSDATVVLGVNEGTIPANAQVISNASCTTNCLAPVVKVLHDNFGIVKGLVTTIHSYTNDQNLLDLAHKDMRRARAAAVSMIPSTTGAAKAIGLVIPDLKGKLDGLAVRVPTPNVSLVDFVAEVKKDTTKDEVNAALKAAAESGPMAAYLNYTELPLVSIDFNHDPASSTVDAGSTYVVGNLVKVLSWYDNEWGYSCRMVDLINLLAKK
jgi:glyceraldehyde 3-phosphate dehydrogenase